MALKTSNKNRKPTTLSEKIAELPKDRQERVEQEITILVSGENPLADHWVPVDKFAPHETERTVQEVTGWVPLDKLAPHETEETYQEFMKSRNKN